MNTHTPLTDVEFAHLADEIAHFLQARLVGDILERTEDPEERAKLFAAVLALVTRRFLHSLPYTDPHQWLEEMIRAVLR